MKQEAIQRGIEVFLQIVRAYQVHVVVTKEKKGNNDRSACPAEASKDPSIDTLKNEKQRQWDQWGERPVPEGNDLAQVAVQNRAVSGQIEGLGYIVALTVKPVVPAENGSLEDPNCHKRECKPCRENQETLEGFHARSKHWQ